MYYEDNKTLEQLHKQA